MADILQFRPRPRPASAGPVYLRAELEETLQFTLDAAERLIAVLDGMDGNPDDEAGGDEEPSLGAPEGHASQVVWLRGTARDLELNHQLETSLENPPHNARRPRPRSAKRRARPRPAPSLARQSLEPGGL